MVNKEIKKLMKRFKPNMKIKNKPLFYTGLSFQIIQFSAIAIFGLTLIDWSWLTERVLMTIGIISIIVLYNGLSLLLIKSGLGYEEEEW